MAGDDVAHGGGNSNGPELRAVSDVFVEAEQVRVSEVANDVLWYVDLKN